MDVTIEPGTQVRPHRRSEPGVAPAPEPAPEAAPAIPVEPAEALELLSQDEIERELRLIDAAISMVRRGVARRVTLASMPLGHAVLFAAQSRAALHRLAVRAVTDVEGGPIAVIVETPEG